MKLIAWKSFIPLLLTAFATPSLTGFVLLGKQKSTLPATPAAPTIEFLYDPNGEVPGLSNKDAILNGIYANHTDIQLLPILLQLAMDQWNSIRGSYLRLSLKASPTKPERSTSDRLNVILAERNANASTAAFATPQNNPDIPDEIYDCDISISLKGVSAQSFLETVTHELGHCVGLGHPHNNYGAIMSYSRGGKSYKLGADDKAGAIYLYPDPTYVDSNPTELIGCGNVGMGKSSSRWFSLLLFVVPFLFIVRKSILRKSIVRKSRVLTR
ncbi:MAG: M57 family metalloprotease [Proteobacteria bacterium]|nr:M57 family metalloprotease [Pseudomonadota bacterium]